MGPARPLQHTNAQPGPRIPNTHQTIGPPFAAKAQCSPNPRTVHMPEFGTRHGARGWLGVLPTNPSPPAAFAVRQSVEHRTFQPGKGLMVAWLGCPAHLTIRIHFLVETDRGPEIGVGR
ncbi:hypothetical protein BRADI_1g12196v3 [Brachypodium distachyon]|uniref:Uncharacterized protein n=1 Tax=Brachypodium distachyon TaxID=15368 RepID=A0A2K2DJ48_BRADI|nr:hypothetical protein BRADI_1g12196v3 [Brachypodium distachyon]PNT74294.1 hypothetical protein BRADI_1g12196v3 [Brachypodium distachyon]PNT74295.1 hypothetical protein BRADI_1g12196v3 [Brachypodium distachyon]PNT74296.1 hypothetical protein BRADI_1g12196v3 [Brachypodium distachyon]